MKHLVIKVAEPIYSISRVRNVVFMSDRRTICIMGKDRLDDIFKYIHKAIKEDDCKRRAVLKYPAPEGKVYNKIVLCGPYHFECTKDDRIIVVRGNDFMYEVNEFGEPIPSDYDIDSNIMYDLQKLKELKKGKLC